MSNFKSNGLIAGFCLFAAALAFDAGAQTLAPDDTITLPQPSIGPTVTSMTLKGVTVQTRTVTLKRTFLEDFSNFQLSANDKSTTGWKTHFPFTDEKVWQGRNLPGNNEQQIYVDPSYKGSGSYAMGINPFSVYNKTLSVIAKRIPANLQKNLTFPVAGGAPKTFQYTSGLLTTYNTFYQTYGYFEFKANLPRTESAWSGMWMLPQSVKWPPEIDVMEVYNRPKVRPANEGINATHTGTSAALVNNGCYVNLAAGAHVYGVLWTPESMTYYEDRKPICMFKTPAGLNEPMYLILQLGIGPNVSATTPNEIYMQVNWVTAYKIQ